MHSRRLLLLPLALATLGGCVATKRDVRDLRAEMTTLRTSQEALLQEIRQELRRQNALILDTLSIQDVRLRGELANRMVQLERQLIQIQELTGQGQQRLEQLRAEVRAQEEALRAAAAASTAAAAAGPNGADAGDPIELFDAAKESLDRGSFATARAGFEEFLRVFPQHARAPEALLYVGESREKANEPEPALQAYQRVVELHPNSTQAPTALYRAALIENARRNRTAARTMLNQLVNAYPNSREVAQAREQLRRMPQ